MGEVEGVEGGGWLRVGGWRMGIGSLERGSVVGMVWVWVKRWMAGYLPDGIE